MTAYSNFYQPVTIIQGQSAIRAFAKDGVHVGACPLCHYLKINHPSPLLEGETKSYRLPFDSKLIDFRFVGAGELHLLITDKATHFPLSKGDLIPSGYGLKLVGGVGGISSAWIALEEIYLYSPTTALESFQ